MSKQEILEKLKNARSWREAGVSVQDVYNAFLECGEGGGTSSDAEAAKQIAELQEKNLRLTETNKQLRSENKQLRAGK